MLEQKPLQLVTFPPEGGDRYKVRTGDSWDSVAHANDLDTWALIEFNFPVVKNEADFQTKCRMVNWLLHHQVGCTKSADGKNYRFDSGDSPGYIYIPLANVAPVFTHRVKLHFRSLSLTDVPFDNAFRSAQRVYAQYGIRIDFASGLSFGLPDDQAQRLANVSGSCEWEITSGDYHEVQGLAGNLPRTEILVCYVNRFASGKLGCGGHAPDKPACIVASQGSRWTTGHEVGHVLLGSAFRPVHTGSTSNLMYSATPGIIANPPSLTPEQVTQMKRSVCCVSL
ncbi:MAG: hypothetical protein ABI823_15130 [Bryobacteraceae bacterium]